MKNGLLALLFFIGIAADQVAKNWAIKLFQNQELFAVCDVFNISFVMNKGVSFGFLRAGEVYQTYLLILMAVVLCVIVGYWFYKATCYFQKFFYTLILSGAVGNIWDRYAYGAVVDFLDLHYKSYHWPAFNIADVLISLGVIGILLISFRQKSE